MPRFRKTLKVDAQQAQTLYDLLGRAQNDTFAAIRLAQKEGRQGDIEKLKDRYMHLWRTQLNLIVQPKPKAPPEGETDQDAAESYTCSGCNRIINVYVVGDGDRPGRTEEYGHGQRCSLVPAMES